MWRTSRGRELALQGRRPPAEGIRPPAKGIPASLRGRPANGQVTRGGNSLVGRRLGLAKRGRAGPRYRPCSFLLPTVAMSDADPLTRDELAAGLGSWLRHLQRSGVSHLPRGEAARAEAWWAAAVAAPPSSASQPATAAGASPSAPPAPAETAPAESAPQPPGSAPAVPPAAPPRSADAPPPASGLPV